MLGIFTWVLVKIFVTFARWLSLLGCFFCNILTRCGRTQRKKVVIVGSGFSGAFVAKNLQDDHLFEVTVITLEPYFQYTPGIYALPCYPDYSQYLQAPLENFLPRCKILVGNVKRATSDTVFVDLKSGDSIRINFDILVCATGCRYKQAHLESDAVIDDVSSKGLAEASKRLQTASRVLIIGGGLVGIEVAAELKRIYGDDKHVTIVHSDNSILQRLDKQTAEYVEGHLRRNYEKINIICNRKIVSVRDDYDFYTDKGEYLHADVAFMCAGAKPATQFLESHFGSRLTDKKFVRVNRHLQMDGEPHIFAVGDITNIQEEKMAAHARLHADVAAENIRRYSRGRYVVSTMQSQMHDAQGI
eukprot:TRINITY_DN6104_c0_g1_i3.p1 TRINITY_DN6104_c0_g1~~TRINITY_DN6104_c0_g1_i3.p1  ORF type:complete len:359 (+),score=62.74 TRINITY_DN6104_c0_g1_i3:43-1119(+)